MAGNIQLGLFDEPERRDDPKLTYCCLDFETGGLDPKECGLCSVAIILTDQYLHEFFRFYFVLYEPEKRYDEGALKVNGFTIEQLEREGMRQKSFIPALHQLIDPYIMVNHNSPFDCDFLRQREFTVSQSCDTLVNDREISPTVKHNLGAVYNRLFGRQMLNAHNALADVEAMIEILKWQIAKNPKYGQPKPIVWDRNRR